MFHFPYPLWYYISSVKTAFYQRQWRDVILPEDGDGVGNDDALHGSDGDVQTSQRTALIYPCQYDVN